MISYSDLFLCLLELVRTKKDAALFIATASNRSIAIAVKQGEIIGLRSGIEQGMAVVPLIRDSIINSYQVRSYYGQSLLRKEQQLPATSRLLQVLAPQPEHLATGQSSAEISPERIVKSVVKQPFIPSVSVLEILTDVQSSDAHVLSPERYSTLSKRELSDNKSQSVITEIIEMLKRSLQETVGPISALIYDDVLDELGIVRTVDDLYVFIDRLVEEIGIVDYQQQFRDRVQHLLLEYESNQLID